eukprot:c23741_g1_i1.p1 GENE.c23741_g1_i1~~c23741_g1_i1.p1  ORF type:complete len:134 (+),score=22.40 c23741_g1_i1:59-460(+)
MLFHPKSTPTPWQKRCNNKKKMQQCGKKVWMNPEFWTFLGLCFVRFWWFDRGKKKQKKLLFPQFRALQTVDFPFNAAQRRHHDFFEPQQGRKKALRSFLQIQQDDNPAKLIASSTRFGNITASFVAGVVLGAF